MKFNFLTRISKQLLALTAIAGLGVASVSPALADNHTESMESSTEMKTQMDEASTIGHKLRKSEKSQEKKQIMSNSDRAGN